ncbi:MAG: hypothetical protein H6Q89_831 [Myxococcaceae bacterium]|nr:hypothetical protein [Myxococcaceae bacterium]
MTYTRAAGLLLLVAGCGPQVADLPNCLQFSQPGGEAVTTTAPGKVSAFFSLDTCAGQPVGGLTGDDFQILEDGNPVSPYESRRTVQPKGQRYQMDSLVLIDFSGSILRSNSWPVVREAATKYVETVLARAGDGQRVAIYTFDGRAAPQKVVGFTGDKAALAAGLKSLEERQCDTSAQCAGHPEAKTCAAYRCVDDSTNLNGALVRGIELLEAESAAVKDIAFKDSSLVVFTDGTDQAARVSNATVLARARASTVHVFTVGLGTEVDATVLESYGKDGFYPANAPAELALSFSSIAQKVAGLANRYYLLEYCSPKRSGRHELKLVARWSTPAQGELVGSMTREFDATGFESGCDLVGD